jgi:hypothetical protein
LNYYYLIKLPKMTNKITRAATMLWDANPPIRDASSPTVLAENNAIFWGE